MMGSEFRPWAGSSELGLEGGSTQGRRRGLLRRLSAPPAAGQPERGSVSSCPQPCQSRPLTVPASDGAADMRGG